MAIGETTPESATPDPESTTPFIPEMLSCCDAASACGTVEESKPVVPPTEQVNTVQPAEQINIAPPTEQINTAPPTEQINIVPPAQETNIVPPTENIPPCTPCTVVEETKISQDFQNIPEAMTSTPKKSNSKKKIRFMDESLSKIHVFPGLTSFDESRRPTQNYASHLPVISDEPAPYNPILYTFRVPKKWPPTLSQMMVKSPPFYLLLDHTIAVIWCMFNPNTKKELGINQVQWALCFLNSIYNRKNERPKDIQLCIDALEDYLIELYAEVNNKLEVLKFSENFSHAFDESSSPEASFSINYSELHPKAERLKESPMDGGKLTNTDDVYRSEIEELRDVAGADSVELLTSKSREAAIDYLNTTRSKHIKNLVKEAKRVRSLENLLNIIAANQDKTQIMSETLILSMLRQDESSDIENTNQIGKNA